MNMDNLTPQQLVVVGLVLRGKTNKEIGGHLGLSEKTIKAHITNIFKKLECKTRSQLIARHYLERANDHPRTDG